MSSERNQGKKDAFDELMSSLSDDMVFAELTDEMHTVDRIAQEEAERIATIYRGDWEEEPLSEVVNEIVDHFHLYCQRYGIDPIATSPIPEFYGNVFQDVALEFIHIRRQLWQGDVVRADGAITVEVVPIDDQTSRLEIAASDTSVGVVGQFMRPVLGPIPDDVFLKTNGEFGAPPVGIGLKLKRPFLVDPDGEFHHDAFSSEEITVALGNSGMKLFRLVPKITL